MRARAIRFGFARLDRSACIGRKPAIRMGGCRLADYRIGGEYLDIPAENFDPRIEFTFFWKDRNAWEGRNYQVEAY